jgi:repressor LexA
MDNQTLKRYARQLHDFYLKAKRMPSYAEMLKVFRLRSKNAVAKRVAQLVEAGLIAKDAAGRLLPAKVQRPARLLGFIKAGFPSPAEEETVDLMSLDEYLISSPEATFLLKVDGDSMIDAGILPGDLVLIQRNLTPRQGDIVVACVDDEWVLKYFEKSGGRVRLLAANKKYRPIEPRRELTVAGVVIANVRKYK